TPLVTAAYLLARETHAPNLYFTSAIGQGICRNPAPMSITNIESLWLDRSLTNVGFVRAAADILPSLKPKEFFRPAQVDPWGNFNNVAIGRHYLTNPQRQARLRLPGTGGIPDVTTFIEGILLYVPQHSRVTFVENLDVVSGLGHTEKRRAGQGPLALISNLGQFDFFNGKMRLVTIHPGVTLEHIQRHTGFQFEIASDFHETSLPTEFELDILRHKIDPYGIRKLELLSGPERRQLLTKIIEQEQQGR
ncbi:MAG: hypothetical protein ACPL0B_03235, partial [Anaerolineales bacterium]